jgi:ABC-type sugar transport system ATPase subunit
MNGAKGHQGHCRREENDRGQQGAEWIVLGLDMDPQTPVKHLSIAQQQMVGSCEGALAEVKLVIMDEPTSSLTAAKSPSCLKSLNG